MYLWFDASKRYSKSDLPWLQLNPDVVLFWRNSATRGPYWFRELHICWTEDWPIHHRVPNNVHQGRHIFTTHDHHHLGDLACRTEDFSRPRLCIRSQRFPSPPLSVDNGRRRHPSFEAPRSNRPHKHSLWQTPADINILKVVAGMEVPNSPIDSTDSQIVDYLRLGPRFRVVLESSSFLQHERRLKRAWTSFLGIWVATGCQYYRFHNGQPVSFDPPSWVGAPAASGSHRLRRPQTDQRRAGGGETSRGPERPQEDWNPGYGACRRRNTEENTPAEVDVNLGMWQNVDQTRPKVIAGAAPE